MFDESLVFCLLLTVPLRPKFGSKYASESDVVYFKFSYTIRAVVGTSDTRAAYYRLIALAGSHTGHTRTRCANYCPNCTGECVINCIIESGLPCTSGYGLEPGLSKLTPNRIHF